MNFTTLEAQASHDRTSFGVLWGARPRVLARRGRRELWWIPGHTGYAGRFRGNEYHPGDLRVILLPDPKASRDNVDDRKYEGLGHKLHDGGRLSKKLLAHLTAQIDEHMQVQGLADRLDPQKTVVVEGR